MGDLIDRIGQLLSSLNSTPTAPAGPSTVQIRQQASDDLVAGVPAEHQAAVRQALTALYEARDANAVDTSPGKRASTSALSTAEKQLSNVLVKSSTTKTAAAGKTADPAQKASWLADADYHQHLADFLSTKSQLLVEDNAVSQQKLQAEAEASAARANLDAVHAQIYAAKTQPEIDVLLARQADLVADANKKNLITPAEVGKYNAQTALFIANTSLIQDKDQYLLPEQVKEAIANGNLKQSEADQTTALTPVKVDYFESRTGLNVAKVQQTIAKINGWQVAPSQDQNKPYLTMVQPSTGQTKTVPNDSYVPAGVQAMKDQQGLVDWLHQQLSDGKMSPEDANNMLDNAHTVQRATSLGVTPEQFLSREQTQADMGRGILGSMASQGNTQADQFRQIADKVRDPSVFAGITPFQTSAGMLGGSPMIQRALDLINQVKPIAGRYDAMSNVSQLSGASQMLGQALDQHPALQSMGLTSADLLPAGARGGGGAAPAAAPSSPASPSSPAPGPPDTGPRGGLDYLFNNPSSPIANPANTSGGLTDADRFLAASRGGT